jgi:UDP-N-acetylmuramoyl-L-alanyl-D-glutamate--2,6-diaminopimelate ligase
MAMNGVKNLARRVIPKSYIKKAEKTYRLTKVKTANTYYRQPGKDLRVIAVTGTNGKTTTCAFINEILKSAGLKTAVCTTAYTEINGVNTPNRNHMTVASTWSVQRFLAKAKQAKVDWVILEVTSHALDQYRIKGVPIEVAVITNISQDHLDYHGTMENYAAAKRRLITDFTPKIVILNADDEWFGYFNEATSGKAISVGKGMATFQMKQLQISALETKLSLVSPKGVLNLKTSLIGEFNAYNAAMSAATAQAIGIDKAAIVSGVANLPIVPGRLEPVIAGQSFHVLVDYAHTPDALKNVLEALKKATEGKLLLVFGATGDRDKSKRPLMGEAAVRYADKIYLTDDETYTEDPVIVRLGVMEGINKAGGATKTVEIPDRREAIIQAFKDAGAGDIVLLTGIGHQDYRNMGGKKLPWDERKVAKELLTEGLAK